MLVKLFCFIFGHKRTWLDFTGEYGRHEELDRLTNLMVKPPIYIQRKYSECPRCGARL